MIEQTIYQKIKESSQFIQAQIPTPPRVGIILGSGLGSIADELIDPIILPYSKIPHFHIPTVEGHVGRAVMGKLNQVPTIILQGRFHFYEGHSMEEVVVPTRTLCAMGIHTLILTNAAGGINTRFRAGDLMVIEDHLNLMGDNPLKGKKSTELGPRFPDMTEAYHSQCREILRSVASDQDILLQTGVYAGLSGPTYETPAEVRMLRTLGADAVGMSTVPECIAANHLGVRVAAISCITNLAAGMSGQKLNHLEVMEVSRLSVEKMKRLLFEAIPKIDTLK